MTRKPVPHPLIGETAWMLLAEAANDVHHPMRVVVLATVDAARHPRARHMVLRGANRDLARIWFHSDHDSEKVAEIHAWPHVTVAGYDPRLGVQLRLCGTASLHEDDATARDHWEQVDLTLRHTYGEPAAGERLPFEDPRLDRMWHHHDQTSRTEDRRRFVVIEVQVQSIHWLQTIGARQWSGLIKVAEKSPHGRLSANVRCRNRSRSEQKVPRSE